MEENLERTRVQEAQALGVECLSLGLLFRTIDLEVDHWRCLCPAYLPTEIHRWGVVVVEVLEE